MQPDTQITESRDGRDAEYFARRREIAAAAKRVGHVGPAVPLDPNS